VSLHPGIDPPAFAAIDLDGTILDSTGAVSGRMETGLRALRRRGTRLIVATGRSPYGLDQLRLAPRLLSLFEPIMVLRDGDILWDRRTNAATHQRSLPMDAPPAVRATFSHVICEYPNSIVATTGLAAARYALFYRFPRSAVRLNPELEATPALKVVAFFDPKVHVAAPRLDEANGRLDRASGRLVVTPRDSCKAAGLRWVLSRFYGEPGFDRVMAIGDGPNDECLLGAVRHGVAMTHAARRTAARASHTLAGPLEEFLESFGDRLPAATRRPQPCRHIAGWMGGR
jgi:hydroxymethylpyrimidine pyrophosphatase-like HAD family hydrolase